MSKYIEFNGAAILDPGDVATRVFQQSSVSWEGPSADTPLWKHDIAAVLVRDAESPDLRVIIQHNFSQHWHSLGSRLHVFSEVAAHLGVVQGWLLLSIHKGGETSVHMH